MKRSHKNKLDKLLREKVLKDRCEWCKKPHRMLNVHHIIGRRNMQIRWDPENICILCPGCHTFKTESAHQDPGLFMDWIRKKRGEEWYTELRRKANMVDKPDYEQILDKLDGDDGS